MKINYKSEYFKWGITVFIVLIAAITFYFVIERVDTLTFSLGKFIKILRPFIYGLVIAYLLCPIYNITTKLLNKYFVEKYKIPRMETLVRILSTVAAIMVAFIVVGGLSILVFPQMIESLTKLAKSAPKSFESLVAWSQEQIFVNRTVNSITKVLMGDYAHDLNRWIKEVVLPQIIEFTSAFSNGILDIANVMADLLIGVIVCIYFLNSKDVFKVQAKKITYALLERKNARHLITEFSFINRTFSSFVNGKIIDSAIVGFICFICMSIFKMPYAMLVSVIIGVTNVIPFFGPFIGAIPSIIIIMTVEPIKAFYFMILILVLQQVDGNIIGPKILGDSTGLPGFWVLFAILLGGGLFGFVGMVIGIPIFAVLYSYARRYVDKRLEAKNMPTTFSYYASDKIPVEKNRK